MPSDIEQLEAAAQEAMNEIDSLRETVAKLEDELTDAKTDRDRYLDCLSDINDRTRSILR